MSAAVRHRFAALGVLLVALTSCRLDANVVVSAERDGSGSVSVELVADKELAQRAANAIVEFNTTLDDAKASGWTTDGVRAGNDGSARLALTKHFNTVEEADAILAELSGPDGPFHHLQLTQSRRFGDIRTALVGEAGLAKGLDGLSDDALGSLLGGQEPLASTFTGNLSDEFAITLTTNFPGQKAGRPPVQVPFDDTARTTINLTARDLDLRAQAARRNTWIAFALGGLLFGAFVLLVLRRRRRNKW